MYSIPPPNRKRRFQLRQKDLQSTQQRSVTEAPAKLAANFGALPRVVSRRGDSQKSKRSSTRKSPPRAIDGSQNPLSLCGIGYSAIGQGEIHHLQGGDENPQYSAELLVASSKSEDLTSQLHSRELEYVECDDLLVRATEPAASGRPRDAVTECQLNVASLVNEILQTVIVDPL